MNASTELPTAARHARGVCILQHVTPGSTSAISCGCEATHLIFHPNWGKAMESCSTVAGTLIGKGEFEVVAWDSVDIQAWKGFAMRQWVMDYLYSEYRQDAAR